MTFWDPVAFLIRSRYCDMVSCLSADDVVVYYLDRHPGAFRFVLYAEENPEGKDHEARILTGTDGVRRLRDLMQSVGE